jgi:hypothetical protein
MLSLRSFSFENQCHTSSERYLFTSGAKGESHHHISVPFFLPSQNPKQK